MHFEIYSPSPRPDRVLPTCEYPLEDDLELIGRDANPGVGHRAAPRFTVALPCTEMLPPVAQNLMEFMIRFPST